MSSGFITESEVQEVRKKRQEEWERVRKAEDPIERPEQPSDNRSLFDKLQEQKQKKDMEYEEAHKLKNMIKGLDDDEIEFLDLVDRSKMAADRKKNLEEQKELCDYRNRVATLQEKSLDQKIQAEMSKSKPKSQINRKSQIKLLQGAVVKKSEPKKRKISESETEVKDNITTPCNTGLTCIGILPGLGCYNDSSSDEDESSSDFDEDIHDGNVKKDLLGRKIIKKDVTE